MKMLLAGLVAVLVLLQYRLWLSDEGMREVWHLAGAVESQRADNALQAERNAQMKAEVADLKQGLTALEERARHDLGMITQSETFYQVVDAPGPVADDRQQEPRPIKAAATP
jgi:cell division protein FtsB